MTTYTANNALHLSEAGDLYAVTRTDNNTNWSYIDPLITKCSFAQSTDPGTTDDETSGYAPGSRWFNTTGNKIWECKDATEDAAVWYQIYNAGNPLPMTANWDAGAFQIRCETLYVDLAGGGAAPMTVTSNTKVTNLNADLLDGVEATGFCPSTLAADIDLGSYQVKALKFESDQTTGTAPLVVASTTKVTNLNADKLDDLESTSFVRAVDFTASGDFIVGSGNGTFAKQDLATTKSTLGIGASGTAFWNAFPGTPVRISDSSFKITDTGNGGLYDKAFPHSTIIKWTKVTGGNAQFAMITSAAYTATPDIVTFSILGNDFAENEVTAGSVKYCIHRAVEKEFIVPGFLPGATATTDIAKTIYAPYELYIFSGLARYKTAPATTGGSWDVNATGGNTVFTTKIPIAATATLGTEVVCDCLLDTATTAIAKDVAITLDFESGSTAATPGADATITIFWMPTAWRYLA